MFKNYRIKITIAIILIVCVAIAIVTSSIIASQSTSNESTTSTHTTTNSSTTSSQQSHTHNFGAWQTIEGAIESTNELMGRTCSCGLSENRQFSQNGHVAQVFFVNEQAQTNGDGSYKNPFGSIEEAQNLIRTINKNDFNEIIVYVNTGEYITEGINFSMEDSGNADCPITYKALNGDVILNGGISINANSFVSAKEYPEIYARLSEDSRDYIVVVDLSSQQYGLSANDYGYIYPIGTYTTSNRYQNGLSGEMFGELFINGQRQTLARYPNEGYILTGTPIIEGISSAERKENGDPMGDTIKMDSALLERVSRWTTTDAVWAFGFWKYDWADSSTPIENIDIQNGEITFEYQSFFGIKEGAPYYFYNCLEELDVPGEYYLDRENGLLCYYPSDTLKDSNITISLTSSPILQINSNYISFEGFTLTGTRGNGVVINGNNIKIENCNISGIGGSAIFANGKDIKILTNIISNIGIDGISVSGGDSASLTPSNNLVYNNLIHDWAQIYKTYRAGITLYGVGNICSHNELFNSPHLAITYSGNNNIVEYNLIHDVCLETDDAGAIYAGRSWTSYGNHIRYNLIYDLGSDGHTPDGIYMDDALSGQYIYGNILVDIPKFSIHIGGGRDMVVYGNLIIGNGDSSIRYDARAREGIIKETWFSSHVTQNSGDLWLDLYNSPWQSEIWQSEFPQYSTMIDDFSQLDNPNFIPNPSGSYVTKNIIYSTYGNIGNIDDDVYNFSNVNENTLSLYMLFKKKYANVRENEYATVFGKLLSNSVEDFESISFDTIGRE